MLVNRVCVHVRTRIKPPIAAGRKPEIGSVVEVAGPGPGSEIRWECARMLETAPSSPPSSSAFS